MDIIHLYFKQRRGDPRSLKGKDSFNLQTLQLNGRESPGLV